MRIEILIAIQSEGKKDIRAILSSIGLASDAIIYVYHYNGSKEGQLDFNGHSVMVVYGPAETKIAAYNVLLNIVSGDCFLFVEPTERLVDGYPMLIESALTSNSKTDGIVFGCQCATKRVKYRSRNSLSLSNLCIRSNFVRSRAASFIDPKDKSCFLGSVQSFVRDCLAWPARFAGVSQTILGKTSNPSLSAIDHGFVDSHIFGMLWPFFFVWRFLRADRKERDGFWAYFRKYRQGHSLYVHQGHVAACEPVKNNLPAFVISCISLTGFATQVVLALLIVFTEVQYIPIWVSLIFLALFGLAYAVSSIKVHNNKALRINTASISVAALIAGLVTYLAMGVSWAMSLYGALICFAVILIVVYCFWPFKGIKRRSR